MAVFDAANVAEPYYYLWIATGDPHRYYFPAITDLAGCRREFRELMRERVALDTDAFRLRPLLFSLATYPNPFNPSTTLAFALPQVAHVTLRVYDLNGRVVAKLADGIFAPGSHAVMFHGRDLLSGIYFARLSTPHAAHTQKLVLLK